MRHSEISSKWQFGSSFVKTNEPGATPISIYFHLDETKYQAAWVWETKEKVSHVTASYVTASWVWGRRERCRV